MRTEKCWLFSDRTEITDTPFPLSIVAYGDEIEIGNSTYSIEQVEEMVAALQTAIMVAQCYQSPAEENLKC
jgi:hypothetical protein